MSLKGFHLETDAFCKKRKKNYAQLLKYMSPTQNRRVTICQELQPKFAKIFSARSRGFIPATLAPIMAMFDAKSPWLRSLVRVKTLVFFQSDGRVPSACRDCTA